MAGMKGASKAARTAYSSAELTAVARAASMADRRADTTGSGEDKQMD